MWERFNRTRTEAIHETTKIGADGAKVGLNALGTWAKIQSCCATMTERRKYHSE